MLSNQIIQSLWIGEKLSNNEILCINSYIKNGHDFHLYTYSKIENIPKGVKKCNANDVIEESKIFLDSKGGIASFSDWFRYMLLYKRGGWWGDMDSICLKFFEIAEEYCFATERHLGSDASTVNIGIIKSPRKAAYLHDCLRYIDSELENYKKGKEVVPYGAFGIQLFRYVVNQYDAVPFIKKPDVFCPIDYFNVEFLIEDSEYVPAQETLSIHLWNEMWRIKSMDKNGSYSPASIYEKMKSLYL